MEASVFKRVDTAISGGYFSEELVVVADMKKQTPLLISRARW